MHAVSICSLVQTKDPIEIILNNGIKLISQGVFILVERDNQPIEASVRRNYRPSSFFQRHILDAEHRIAPAVTFQCSEEQTIRIPRN